MKTMVELVEEKSWSDQKKIRFNLDWEVTHELSPVLVPHFGTADYERLRRFVKEVNWAALWINEAGKAGNWWQGKSCKITMNNLALLILDGQRLYIPYQARRTEQNDPKWITRGLKHNTGLKRRIYREK